AVEERRLVVVARTERRVVAHRLPQRREERVVVEGVGVDRVGLHRRVGREGLVVRGVVLPWRGGVPCLTGGRPVVVGREPRRLGGGRRGGRRLGGRRRPLRRGGRRSGHRARGRGHRRR